MEKLISLAIQYLVSAQHSFIKPTTQSFQNRLWVNSKTACISTARLLNNTDNLILKLNLNDFSLVYINDDLRKEKFDLFNTNHGEIVQWLDKTALSFGIELPFIYQENKELFYPDSITDSFTYEALCKEQLTQHAKFRITIQKILEEIIKEYNLNTEVSIWSQRQETSLYALVNEELDIVLNLGMSVSNSLEQENGYCIYANGWQGLDKIDPIQLKNNMAERPDRTNYRNNIMFVKKPNASIIKNFYLKNIQKFSTYSSKAS